MSGSKRDEILGKRANETPGDVQKIAKTDLEPLESDNEDVDLEGLDERGVKKAILNLERAVLKNREMRIKFSDEPLKFMESEMLLDVAIQEMHSIATVPHHYSLLIKLKAVQSLMQLLMHENTDISCSVVNLIQELTDVDTLNESLAGAEELIDGLLSNQLFQVMVSNLERLNENVKDEADGVHNTLQVLENILELRPNAGDVVVQSGMVGWILNRLKSKRPFDSNRLFCCEILAILLQTNSIAREMLQDKNGIDTLLEQVAVYKKRDPSSADEVEYMEGIFDCLCAALLYPKNKIHFDKAEGFHLMNLMLKEHKQAAEGALKVLSHVFVGDDCQTYCADYIQLFGLSALFNVFMRQPCKAARKNHSIEEHEEHACSLIANLLKNCDGSEKTRFYKKFEENNMENLERLVELRFKYSALLASVEETTDGESLTEEELEEKYLDKLAKGLFTLQLIDYTLAELIVNGGGRLRKAVEKMFSMRRCSFESVKQTLVEFANNLQENDDKQSRSKGYVINLANALDSVANLSANSAC